MFAASLLFFGENMLSFIERKVVEAIYTTLCKAINMMVDLIVCFYIFTKAIDYAASSRKKMFAILWCLVMALLYAVSPAWASLPVIWLVYCAASVVFTITLTKLKPDTVISALLLSFGTGYIIYYIASFAVGAVYTVFASRVYVQGSVLDYNKPAFLLVYTITSAIQLLLSYLLFRIRRFKRGFPFLLKGYAIILALIVTGTVLAITSWGKTVVQTNDAYDTTFLFCGILIIGIGIFIWVKRGIKAAYIRWAKDNNNELHEQMLAEKDREIQRLTERCDALRKANHSINHRLAALERGYVAMLEAPLAFSADVVQELAVSLEDVRRAARDYREGIGLAIREINLPSTKVKMLDALFGLFAERCAAAEIEFTLIVNGSIPYMLERIIPQSKLETMIGDHLQDAVIAVNASDSPFRSITVILGLTDDCYALTVFDSGIPFTVHTLTRLGVERVTTHADSGGSGVGFMKTFETMRECGASLVIDEKEPGTEGYTKSVSIRFDGKNQHINSSYRSAEFPISERYSIFHTGSH